MQVIALLCVINGIINRPVDEVLISDAYAAPNCSIPGTTSCATGAGGPGNLDGVCIGGVCVPDPTGPNPNTGGGGANAPEMPAAFLPLFLLLSAGSFYMVRRRSMKVRHSDR